MNQPEGERIEEIPNARSVASGNAPVIDQLKSFLPQVEAQEGDSEKSGN